MRSSWRGHVHTSWCCFVTGPVRIDSCFIGYHVIPSDTPNYRNKMLVVSQVANTSSEMNGDLLVEEMAEVSLRGLLIPLMATLVLCYSLVLVKMEAEQYF